MDNLMTVVESGEKFQYKPLERGEEKIVKIEELKQLGFTALAQKLEKELIEQEKFDRLGKFGYIVIKEANIIKFLEKKVEAYNATRPKPKKAKNENPSDNIFYDFIGYNHQSLLRIMSDSIFSDVSITNGESLSRKTVDSNLTEDGTIGRYVWTEEKVEGYKTLPPSDVLKSLEVHKARGVFDYFTIASVNAVKDPLLLGRIEGMSDRFFIAQWGEDVQLDDVI